MTDTETRKDDEASVWADQEFLVGDGSGRLGDCLRACVASVFGLTRGDVPHFVEDPDWFGALCRWASGCGFDVTYEPPSWPMAAAHPYVVALGVSPRDPEGTHAVVADAWTGDVVHDPHPSRDFLVGDPTSVIAFVLAVLP